MNIIEAIEKARETDCAIMMPELKGTTYLALHDDGLLHSDCGFVETLSEEEMLSDKWELYPHRNYIHKQQPQTLGSLICGEPMELESKRDHRPSIIIVLLICLICAICGSALTGCSTLGNGKVDVPVVGTPYQAGRTFVFVDTVTEPFQPAEVSAVIDQVYALAQTNLDADSLLDEVVRAQIDQTYADAPQETRDLIYNVYGALRARLDYQVSLNPELPKLEVFYEFNRGIRDALAMYQPPE